MYSKEETTQLRKQFWLSFDEYSKPYLPKNGKWMTYNTGIKDMNLKFDVSRNYARVLLAVENKNEDLRFDIFCKLHECELVLENYLGADWIWDETFTLENGKNVCALYKQINGVDMLQKECWDKMHKFLAEEMQKLEKAITEIRPFFEDYVKNLIKKDSY